MHNLNAEKIANGVRRRIRSRPPTVAFDSLPDCEVSKDQPSSLEKFAREFEDKLRERGCLSGTFESKSFESISENYRFRIRNLVESWPHPLSNEDLLFVTMTLKTLDLIHTLEYS